MSTYVRNNLTCVCDYHLKMQQRNFTSNEKNAIQNP